MDEAVVISRRAKLAERPGGKVLGSLPEGTRVTVRGGPAAWVEVEVEGTIGVVSRRTLTFTALQQAGLEAVPAPPAVPPPAEPADIQVTGAKVLGPGGIRFGTIHKLGLFNYGETSLGPFFEQYPGAFPGLAASVVRVMQAVSDNEGNFEAINTWDDAILSCSIYQWTTAAGAGAGELPFALSFLKADAPASFQTYFGDEGLDVNVGAGGVTGFFVLDGKTLSSEASKAALRKHIWAYRFWRAAHDPDVRHAYVKAAISRIDRFYPVKIAALENRPMSDFVTSEVGIAHILDQHVNRPGHVPKTLVMAVKVFWAAGGPADPESWKDEDERRVLEIYLAERAKTSMTDSGPRAMRIKAYVTVGKLSNKRGSFKPGGNVA